MIAGPYHQAELPRECALSLLSSVADPITGAPTIPPADGVADSGRAAAEELLRALTSLLDEARGAGLAALRKGGIGARERTRLTTRVGVGEPELASRPGPRDRPAGSRRRPIPGNPGLRPLARSGAGSAMGAARTGLVRPRDRSDQPGDRR